MTVGVRLVREWVASGGCAWLSLRGDSMCPFLPNGSRLQVEYVAPDHITMGDLLVYEVDEALICHRVLRRRARGADYTFLTKGDGHRTLEAWIGAAQVLGRVVAVERRGRELRLQRPGRRLHAMAAAAASLGWVVLRAALSRCRGRAQVAAT